MTPEPPTVPAWQLALRFALEVGALIALGSWASGVAGLAGAIGLPLLAAALWVTFAVRGDPSRSGKAPVPVPGALRLGVEMLVLLGGAGTLAAEERWGWLAAFGAAFLVHHLGTLPRLRWLLAQR